MIVYKPGGGQLIDVVLENDSFHEEAIMQSPRLVLSFVLGEYLDIPLMSYAQWRGDKYLLWTTPTIKKQSSREYRYTLQLVGYSDQLKFVRYKLIAEATEEMQVKFLLSGKPQLFLELLIKNLNQNIDGWTIGEVLDCPEKTIAFNHEDCYSALNRLAEEFDTEWVVEGQRISLAKVSRYKDAPIRLAYGKGNGLLPGVEFANDGDKLPVGRLFVQGGDKNIDFASYGSRVLLLPKSATLVHEGVTYHTDDKGSYISIAGWSMAGRCEDSYDGSEIYPKRVGTVSRVAAISKQTESGESYLDYDIFDSSIPEALDYGKCVMGGEKAYITFQSGRLAGQSFDIEATPEALTGYIHSERRFRLVRSERDGYMMPEPTTFYPSIGDKYSVFGVRLPQAYISDDATKSGASWELFREAVRYFHENKDPKLIYTAELDGIHAQKHWNEIGARVTLGGHALIEDAPMGVSQLIRITSIRTELERPYKPKLTLSNSIARSGIGTSLGKVEAEEVHRSYSDKETKAQTKRSFDEALRLSSDIGKALGDKFERSISPVAVRTMQLLVGDPSLQFQFIESRRSHRVVQHTPTYDSGRAILRVPRGFIKHLALGIDSIKPNRKNSDYKVWEVAQNDIALREDQGLMYLYARCSKTTSEGVFRLSAEPIAMESEEGYYNLLVGLLSAEPRVFTPLYGFSEVLPGQIRTGLISSADGRTYFDLDRGVIGGNLVFRGTDSEDPEIDAKGYIDGLIHDTNERIKDSSLSVEYSEDGRTGWHEGGRSTDRYLRQRVGDDGVWSEAIRIAGEDAIMVQVWSNSGNVFANGQVDAELVAFVFRGAQDISDSIPPSNYSWKRTSTNTDTDRVWNSLHSGIGRVLTLSSEDVVRRATFDVAVSIDNY